MRGCLLGGILVLVLPWFALVVTNLLAGDALVNLVLFVGIGVALLVSFAVAQGTGLVIAVSRLLRFFVGGDPDAPLALWEKLLIAAGPLVLCTVIFTVLALGMWGLGAIPPLLAGFWMGLGAVYGVILAFGLLTGALDPDDVDALGLEADQPEVVAHERRRRDRDLV